MPRRGASRVSKKKVLRRSLLFVHRKDRPSQKSKAWIERTGRKEQVSDVRRKPVNRLFSPGRCPTSQVSSPPFYNSIQFFFSFTSFQWWMNSLCWDYWRLVSSTHPPLIPHQEKPGTCLLRRDVTAHSGSSVWRQSRQDKALAIW